MGWEKDFKIVISLALKEAEESVQNEISWFCTQLSLPFI